MKSCFFALKMFFLAVVSAYAFDSVEQCNVIGSALKQYYGIHGDLELTATTPLAPLAVKPTSVELLEMPSAPVAMMPVKVRYMNGDKAVSDVAATFRVQWRVGILKAKHPLTKGPLDVTAFDVDTVDRLSLHQTPVEADANLKGYEVVDMIPAGVTLTWNYLRAQPLVHKGSLVDVIAEEGGMRITTRAVALADAGRGETVTMRNLTTNHPFEAFVVNENLVQIHF